MNFRDALHAEGPASERREQLALYAFLIGSWLADVRTHDEAGTHHGTCEIHAGWILRGRAIQDVWMVPASNDRGRAPPLPVAGDWYGSTLRIYDPQLDGWRIMWNDPLGGNFMQQIGGADAEGIVQLSEDGPRGRSRWSFRDITPTSFHWRGERSLDHGASWLLQVEVLARRA